jgi:hypothetical protein
MRVELEAVLTGSSRLPVTSTGPEGESVSGLAREMSGGVHHSQNLVAEQEGLIGSRGYREAWAPGNPEGVASALEAAWV